MNWLTRQTSGYASTAFEYFAHASIFERPSALLVFNESASTLVSLLLEIGNKNIFFWRIDRRNEVRSL